jgi:hypothetical protein
MSHLIVQTPELVVWLTRLVLPCRAVVLLTFTSFVLGIVLVSTLLDDAAC